MSVSSHAPAIPADNISAYRFPPAAEQKLQVYESLFGGISGGGLRFMGRVQTLVALLQSLEHVIAHPEENPWPTLTGALDRQIAVLEEIRGIQKDMLPVSGAPARLFNDADRVEQLFEDAWTTYSDAVYDHSVKLVEDRLRATGYDESWFKGKRCFDGGCGTGRLSIAMAKMGAREVVAVDVGQASLDFFAKTIERYKLKNIVIRRGDVTKLDGYDSNSFDFVASNGVLHHTPDCLGGVKEHYRITAKGGCFWLYLYGAGGFYWEIYDHLRVLVRDFDTADVKQAMRLMQIREGLIYTLLDNVFAARTYYYQSDVLDLLRRQAPLDWKYQDGPAIYDSMERFIKTPHGKDILGPEGEVRMAVTKLAEGI